jgi:NitT/TauT family transport system substrate-binding protein
MPHGEEVDRRRTGVTRARALALAGAAALAGVPRRSRAQSPAQSPAAAAIRLGASPSDSYAEAYFAQESGTFAKYGLTVEIVSFPNAQAIVAAAVGGAIDAGMADMIQLVNPIQRGVPLGYFAGGAVYHSETPPTLLVASKTTALQKPKDFEGQTIGVVALNSISAMCVSEWLRQGGADLAKVKIYELPFSTMVPALDRGTIAAAFLAEPFLSVNRADLRVVAPAYDQIAKQFYIAAWFTTRDWVTKNPDAAKRLQSAIYETARWANGHHDDSAVILSKATKLDLDRIRSMTRAIWATSLDPKLMQPVIDLAAKYKLIEAPVNAGDLILRIS